LEERRLLYAGALDPTFGVHGVSVISLGYPLHLPPLNSFANATALDASGNIVIAGNIEDQGGVSSMLVERLNPYGVLDTTFNGTGYELLPNPVGFQAGAGGVAMDAQGKIVVAGTATEANSATEIVVERLNPDGSPDLSFGTNGMVLFGDSYGGSLTGVAMTIQHDGKIIVTGHDAFNPGPTFVSYFALVRLNHDGSVDQSFSSSNIPSLPPQPGLALTDLKQGPPGADDGEPDSLAIAPDGTIAVAGASAFNCMGAMVVDHSDGSLDTNFGGNGIWVGYTTPYGFEAHGVTFQPDGKIVMVGDGALTSNLTLVNFNVSRFLPNGGLDPSFGSGGTVNLTFPDTIGGATARTVALQLNGKIVVAGSSDDGPKHGGANFALARLNLDGSLDTSFNFNGLVTTDIFSRGNPDSVNALALQPDGKIVAVGDTLDAFGNNAVAVARYLGDPGQLNCIPNPPGGHLIGESAGLASVIVQRTDGATGTVTVDYATSDGTATAGADYTPVSGTLTFPDGQTSQTINIPLLDDGTLEGGSETINVTLSNPTGGATPGTQTTTQVTILDPDLLTNPATATEGMPFTRVLARFAGSNPAVAIGDYAASINWGDAATAPDITPGVLSPDPRGGFDVTGTHTYAEEGTYAVTVTMTGGDNISGGTTITVGDATLTAAAVNLNVIGTKNFSGPVATFKDTDPAGTASDYTATIAWDDGTTTTGNATTGMITGTGPFTISASHVFGSFSGTHQITVVITDAVGSKTSVTDTVTDPTPSERYVIQLYQDLLGRAADPAGLASWSGLLDAGTPRTQVALAITQSQEYRQDEVQALYAHYLYRNADPAGLAAFTQLLVSGGTVEQVAAAMVSSAEYYQNRSGGTNTGFLDDLYHDALGRTIDPSGASFFRQALTDGEGRGQVAAALFGSTEYRQDLVQSYYRNYLHRPADASGLADFVNALADGTTDDQVLATVLGSEEFFTTL
jgi:uncharacterized delta-60 repeat protein